MVQTKILFMNNTVRKNFGELLTILPNQQMPLKSQTNFRSRYNTKLFVLIPSTSEKFPINFRAPKIFYFEVQSCWLFCFGKIRWQFEIRTSPLVIITPLVSSCQAHPSRLFFHLTALAPDSAAPRSMCAPATSALHPG
jgi:hypothetical protein